MCLPSIDNRRNTGSYSQGCFYLSVMKADFQIVLNDLQLRSLLHSFSIADCKIAIEVLHQKITRFENEKLTRQLKTRMLNETFLDLPIEEFDLSVRAFNCLKKSGLNTVRDIKEFGVERLSIIRHVGDRTAEEIKRVIFDK